MTTIPTTNTIPTSQYQAGVLAPRRFLSWPRSCSPSIHRGPRRARSSSTIVVVCGIPDRKTHLVEVVARAVDDQQDPVCLDDLVGGLAEAAEERHRRLELRVEGDSTAGLARKAGADDVRPGGLETHPAGVDPQAFLIRGDSRTGP